MRLEDKTTLNILARTSSSVFLVISSVIMVRFLSKADYGTFLQVMLIINTVIMLAFVGLPHSVFYFYPQTADKRHLVKQTLLIGFGISLAAAVGIFVCRGFLAHLLNNSDIVTYAMFMAVMILFQGPIGFRDPILLSQNALILNSAISLGTCLIDYIPSFIALFLGADLRQLFWVFLWSKFVNLILFLLTINYLLKGTARLDDAEKQQEPKFPRVGLRAQIKYSFPIGIASYIGIIGKQIDKYIISSFFSVSQFAVYSRGAMEVPFISTITYTINDITMPRYVEAYQKRDIQEFLRLMHVNIDKVAKINFGVFVFLFFEARQLIEILYTVEYSSATPIFQAYLFLLFLGITVYNMIPRVTGHTRQLTIATTLSVVINIILSLALIPPLGPIGAAVGTVIGSFSYMAYLLVTSARVLGVSWKAILPLKQLSQTFILACVSIIGVWLFHLGIASFGLHSNFWVLCAAFPVYVYCYLGALNLFGLLRPEDRSYLVRWLRFNLFAFLPQQRFGRT